MIFWFYNEKLDRAIFVERRVNIVHVRRLHTDACFIVYCRLHWILLSTINTALLFASACSWGDRVKHTTLGFMKVTFCSVSMALNVKRWVTRLQWRCSRTLSTASHCLSFG